MRQIRHVSEQHGAKCLVLSVPTRHNRTTFECQFPRDTADGTYGFDVINPIPSFEQHHGELIYWERSHFHFTPLGCRLVAELLAERLKTGYLVTGGAEAGSKTPSE